MNRLRRLIRTWHYRLFPRPLYVVIYDIGDHEEGDEVSEEYYGYFSSRNEARNMYANLSRGQNYHSAKICRVVEDIPDVAG
jgi:hypothetical protein